MCQSSHLINESHHIDELPVGKTIFWERRHNQSVKSGIVDLPNFLGDLISAVTNVQERWSGTTAICGLTNDTRLAEYRGTQGRIPRSQSTFLWQLLGIIRFYGFGLLLKGKLICPQIGLQLANLVFRRRLYFTLLPFGDPPLHASRNGHIKRRDLPTIPRLPFRSKSTIEERVCRSHLTVRLFFLVKVRQGSGYRRFL